MSLLGPYTLVYNMHIIICTCLILGVDFFQGPNHSRSTPGELFKG